MRSVSLTVFSFLSLLATCALASRDDRCIADIFRVVGANDLYSMPCRCNGSLDDYAARATVFIGDSPNTAAQARKTVACLERRRRRLAKDCDRFPEAYEIHTRRAIQHCLNQRPPADAPGQNAPFTFDKSMCRAIFRRVNAGPRLESVLVCACEQRPSYVVHPGVAQFFDLEAPGGSSEEREFIRECTQGQFGTLEETCETDPERFELRSLQLLNVCCKRARVLFDDAKLACQGTVPDDVTQSQLDVITS